MKTMPVYSLVMVFIFVPFGSKIDGLGKETKHTCTQKMIYCKYTGVCVGGGVLSTDNDSSLLLCVSIELPSQEGVLGVMTLWMHSLMALSIFSMYRRTFYYSRGVQAWFSLCINLVNKCICI